MKKNPFKWHTLFLLVCLQISCNRSINHFEQNLTYIQNKKASDEWISKNSIKNEFDEAKWIIYSEYLAQFKWGFVTSLEGRDTTITRVYQTFEMDILADTLNSKINNEKIEFALIVMDPQGSIGYELDRKKVWFIRDRKRFWVSTPDGHLIAEQNEEELKIFSKNLSYFIRNKLIHPCDFLLNYDKNLNN